MLFKCLSRFSFFLSKSSVFLLLFFSFVTLALAAQEVYLTPTGKKYHQQQCTTVRHSSKSIDVKVAQKRQYLPCEICFPQSTTAVRSKNNAKLEVEKVYCSARTSTGTKCLNTVHAPQRLCDEHLQIN